MPIFDYQCQACGHAFDILQKPGDDVLQECPECGDKKLRKLLSAPNFHLKGSGWRNSKDAQPKKPNVRPKYAHMLDSPVPHAEHDDLPSTPPKPGENTHDHSHDHGSGHAHGHGHGHSHSHGPDHKH